MQGGWRAGKAELDGSGDGAEQRCTVKGGSTGPRSRGRPMVDRRESSGIGVVSAVALMCRRLLLLMRRRCRRP